MVSLKYIGHACVMATCDETTILIDPWLTGRCNFDLFRCLPAPYLLSEDEISKVDAICISHLHVDHFCEDSLKQFRRSVPILIGKYRDGVFASRIRRLGFTNVVEVETGLVGREFGGWRVNIFAVNRIYPYDSSLVLTADSNSYLFNNDARFSARQYLFMKRHFGRFVGACVGYADINPFPMCYEFASCSDMSAGFSTREILEIDEEQSWKSVELICEILQPKWVFPYASSIRFDDPELVHLNACFVPPENVLGRKLNRAVAVQIQPGQEIHDAEIPEPAWNFAEQRPVAFGGSGHSVFSKVDLSSRIEEFQNLFFKVFKLEAEKWSAPFRVAVQIADDGEVSHAFGVNFDGSDCHFDSTDDPSIVVSYPSASVLKVLNGHWKFVNLHYSYAFKVRVRKVVSPQFMIHKWGLKS